MTILNANSANGRIPRIFQKAFVKFAPFVFKNRSVEDSVDENFGNEAAFESAG